MLFLRIYLCIHKLVHNIETINLKKRKREMGRYRDEKKGNRSNNYTLEN